MLTRLSRSGRLLAGRIVALLYFACVLAPGSAFAFGNAHLAEHCLFDEGPAVVLSHQHDRGTSNVHHHAGQPPHQHAGHQSGAMHDHGQLLQLATQSAPAPSPSSDHAMQLQCCGMLCIPALPVSVRELATPCPAQAFTVPENGRHLADNVPPRHYRPPIT